MENLHFASLVKSVLLLCLDFPCGTSAGSAEFETQSISPSSLNLGHIQSRDVSVYRGSNRINCVSMCYLTVNCTAININESAIENCQMYDARKLYLTDSGGIEMPIKSDISPGQEYCNDGAVNIEIPTDNFNVTSPLFDDGTYPTNLNCAWKLTAEGTTSSDFVAFQIVFYHLELPIDSNGECTLDHLVLPDGTKLCGSINDLATSTFSLNITGDIFIHFHSDGLDDSGTTPNGGFKFSLIPDLYVDCWDQYQNSPTYTPGVREMSFTNSASNRIYYTAYCADDGWTVFQSRGQFGNPADHFYRGWSSYLQGFGTPGEEAWLGLNTIYHLTNWKTYRLRVKLTAPDGSIGVSYYEVFRLENLGSFNLFVSGYSGNGGDPFTDYHKGNGFSTFDQANGPDSSCATRFRGAWWYKNCHRSNLNGLNFDPVSGDAPASGKGMDWQPFKSGSMMETEMAIRTF